jgi:hypothetical protein
LAISGQTTLPKPVSSKDAMRKQMAELDKVK